MKLEENWNNLSNIINAQIFKMQTFEIQQLLVNKYFFYNFEGSLNLEIILPKISSYLDKIDIYTKQE